MQLIWTRLRRARGDDGFTLIEMIVTVAILGAISAGLVGVVVQYLKTTQDTRARLSESTDQQFVSTYWQNDVSSLGVRTFNDVTGTFDLAQSVFVSPTAGCGSSVGTVVVRLAWNEFPVNAPNPFQAWTTTLHEVAYVTVPKGTRLVLQRVRCRGGTAAAPHTVAHSLTVVPTVTCDTTCGATTLPNRVSMTFTVKDADNADGSGYTTIVSADRRQG